MSLKNLGCFKAKLLGNMGDKTGALDRGHQLVSAFFSKVNVLFQTGGSCFLPQSKKDSVHCTRPLGRSM